MNNLPTVFHQETDEDGYHVMCDIRSGKVTVMITFATDAPEAPLVFKNILSMFPS